LFQEFFWDDLQKATGGSHLRYVNRFTIIEVNDDVSFSSVRRIPNVGHNIQGYQDSLASFYMTICDVNFGLIE